MKRVEEAFRAAVAASHITSPADLIDIVAPVVTAIDGVLVGFWIVDFEQELLMPLHDVTSEPLSVDGSAAGRAFTSSGLVETPNDGSIRVWAPLLDGAERVGVLAIDFSAVDDTTRARVTHLAGMATALYVTKSQYTDFYGQIARRSPMSLSAELQWSLLPPLTFNNAYVAIAGVLAPAYDIGGDTFDYAIGVDELRLSIFDAVGHGMDAVLPSAVALTSVRNSRRHGASLVESYRYADKAISDQFPYGTFVTAQLGTFDPVSGRLRVLNAGHPLPLLLRDGHVSTVNLEASPPLGLGLAPGEPVEVQLMPTDRLLLYSDGVTEGAKPGNEPFGLERLADLFAREALSGHGAGELMRRLARAVLGHHAHDLRDDFTLLALEYRQRQPPR